MFQSINAIAQYLSPYLRLTRVDRPIGTLLLLWPTLWALWLAGDGHPSANIVIIFMAGTFVMRAAGCAINDFADRKIDGKVARTKNRPLATGEIKPIHGVYTFIGLSLIGLALVLQLNIATIKLSFGAVAIAFAYPFCKRFTQLPQFVLGLAFSWGIPMAYMATLGELPLEVWMVFVANFCWIVAYDTQYAMADREDDLKIGVKSTAILFADYDRLIIGLLQLATVLILTTLGVMKDLSWHFYLGIFAAALIAIYQQFLIFAREPMACFQAFLNNTWFGAAVFVGILLATI